MSLIPFQPAPFLRNNHAQTLAGYFLPRLPGRRIRHVGLLHETAILPTQDGTGDRLLVSIHRFTDRAHHDAPVCVLVHGLEGDADSTYNMQLSRKLLNAGFHVVRMNLRTCGRGLHLAGHAYNAGLTIDLETVCDYARKHVAERVVMMGISLGANLTLKLLGEDDEERNRQRLLWGGSRKRRRARPPADAFVAISPPLDLYRSCELLDAPQCRLYRRSFLTDIKNRARLGKFPHTSELPLERELAEIESFFDFDHRFVAPAGGYRGAIEYYMHASARHYIANIDVPGLVLHARDDPLIHPAGWDETPWDSLPHITAHETRHGGHVGWIAKKHPFFPDRRWMDYRVLDWMMNWRDSESKPRRSRRRK